MSAAQPACTPSTLTEQGFAVSWNRPTAPNGLPWAQGMTTQLSWWLGSKHDDSYVYMPLAPRCGLKVASSHCQGPESYSS
mmetsp:Transcript_56429/g.134503  ORF Transcript_56429/g.134503 Transcript_56429/m.134503 type:complete len:80 (-) Transcript_56429:12-251(-)